MIDRHRLYEIAVQSPGLDVELIERIVRRMVGRCPLTLREDFAGTARLSAAWVESHDDREAVAVERDPTVLAYARRQLEALEEDGERVELVAGDVRTRSSRTFDVITAMNFSWALFDDAALDAYLASAAACLEDDGVLVLELFGGSELRRPGNREHRHEGFTYIWEQRRFDAGCLDAHIHFRMDDGRTLRDAFTYRFHLRSLDALRAHLGRAGFRSIILHAEDRAGRHRRTAREPQAPLWRGLLACTTAASSRGPALA